MFAPIQRETTFRPCLLLAHSDPPYTNVASRYFRQCGWDVRRVESSDEARMLAWEVEPTVVVLETGLWDESGWLTCDKLTREHPGLKVILVGVNPTQRDRRFADFVGAAGLVNRRDGVASLVDAVSSAALRAVG